MTGTSTHGVGRFARILGRSLVAALAVQAGMLAISLGYSCAVCNSGDDKLVWGLLLAVVPLTSPYVLALWLAVVAVTTSTLPLLTSRFGWLRTLVGIGVAWMPIFGLAWALSAWLAQRGCSMLV